MTSGEWICRGEKVITPSPFCVVGILNITPDSFSDGTGHIPSVDDTLSQARNMAIAIRSYGCGILDLGAESTNPHAEPVLSEEELSRLLPALSSVRSAFSDIPISVDTTHSSVARAALNAGADIINDVSAFCRDPELLDVVVASQCGYVLTHGGAEHFSGYRRMHLSGCGASPIDGVLSFFEKALSALVRAGLPESHIVLDAGIGFGKSPEENWDILRNIKKLHVFGRPLYAGISRKSLFGWLLGLGEHERDEATQVLTGLLASQGVQYHRVHNVQGAVNALKIASAMSYIYLEE